MLCYHNFFQKSVFYLNVTSYPVISVSCRVEQQLIRLCQYQCHKIAKKCAHIYERVQLGLNPLMGEGFMGGCTPPFTIFFDFRLRSLRYEKDFLPVLSKLSQASMVKIFHF